MSRDKQIAEMAKHCCFPCDMECDGECIEGIDPSKCYGACETANALYLAGYRKASEVAREICEMLREDLRGFVDADYLERLLTIYEKKYTEGEQ